MSGGGPRYSYDFLAMLQSQVADAYGTWYGTNLCNPYPSAVPQHRSINPKKPMTDREAKLLIVGGLRP